ncbi:MAG: hypothetical protein AAF004_08290 [Pseudomonadota bacterium]
MAFNRTFWPVTDARDLPNADEISMGVHAWACEWFGSSVTLSGMSIGAAMLDRGDGFALVGNGTSLLAAMHIEDSVISRVLDSVSVDSSVREDVRSELLIRMLAELIDVLRPNSKQSVGAMRCTGCEHEWLIVELQSDGVSVGAVWLSAELVFALSRSDRVSVIPSVERMLKTVSLHVNAQATVRVPSIDPDKFHRRAAIPIVDLHQHSGFELTIDRKRIGRAFLGRKDSARAIVMEKDCA